MAGGVIPDDVRLVVFDADGTLRRTLVAGQPCPIAPGEWELMPRVRETLQTVDWRGRALRVGVASNQDWIGYGHVSRAMSERLLHDAIAAATAGAAPEPIVRLCPHVPEDHCACRKPAPGMLLAIMAKADARPTETLFVGDMEIDAEAALRAGVRFRWASDFFGW